MSYLVRTHQHQRGRESTATVQSHSERFRAVADDPRIAGRLGLRGLAMQAAEREPAHMTADAIVAETIATFGSQPAFDGGKALREAIAAQEAAGATETIGYVPVEPNRATVAKAGWDMALDAAIAARFFGSVSQ